MLLHLTSKGYGRKLTPINWKEEHSLIGKNVKDLSLDEIADYISQGYGFVFSHCKVHCTKNNFISTQLFAVDIDNDNDDLPNVNRKEIIQRVKEIGGCCICYDSFSNTRKKPKFRILFQVDKPITDIDVANDIALRLVAFIPECDTHSRNIVQNYNGTERHKLIEKFPSNYLDIKALMKKTNKYFNNSDTKNIRLRKNSKYINKCKQDDSKNASSKKTSKNKSVNDKDTSYWVNFHNAYRTCELMYHFNEADIELHHSELMLLGSTSCKMRSGRTWFEKRLKYGKNNYEYEHIMNNMIYYYRHYDNIMNCKGNCRFCNTCQNRGNNIFDKVMNHDKNIKKIVDLTPTLSQDAASEQLNDIVKEFSCIARKQITIVQAPTGLGKTEAYLKNVRAGDIVCTPTHALNKEVYERLKQYHVHVKLIEERPKLPNQYLQTKFDRFILLGDYRGANDLYTEAVERNRCACIPGYEECIKWQDNIRNINDNDIIVCTHKRQMVYFRHLGATVWCDEDPLNSIVGQYEISFRDIYTMQSYIVADDKFSNVYNYLQQLLDKIRCITASTDTNKQYNFNIDMNISSEEKKQFHEFISEHYNDFDSNILALFSAVDKKYIVWKDKLVIVVKNNFFFKHRKYMILSATISEYIFKTLMKLDCSFHNLMLNEYGDIRLYYCKTSRNKLKNNSALCESIKKEIGTDIPILTFKNYEPMFKEAGFNNILTDVYFGKTLGINKYAGENIAVIGTYYTSMLAYFAIAVLFDIPCINNMKWRKVDMNGFEFYCMTFLTEDLHKIQMNIMNTEVEQAVGRARALRTDATVYLFSAFPIRGSKLV